MIIKTHPVAEVDIQAIYEYYEDKRPGLGERFKSKLKQSFETFRGIPNCTDWLMIKFVRHLSGNSHNSFITALNQNVC